MKCNLYFIAIAILLSFSATQSIAQYSRRNPVHITNASNCLPDYQMADKPEAHEAFVESGLMTEEQFKYAVSHSNIPTMPPGIRNDGEWYESRKADLANYKAYKIGTMKEREDDFEATLLWFPRQDNMHMPADLIPEDPQGFFMLCRVFESYSSGHNSVPSTSSSYSTPNAQAQPTRMVTCGTCYGKGYITSTNSTSQQLTPNTYTQDRYGNVTGSRSGQSRKLSSTSTTRCSACGGSGKVQQR